MPIIGSELGPYRIVEEIGEGGMATVYRAYQPAMDRFVALKVIRPTAVEDEARRERFQREARLISRLEHPHVVPVYDFDGTHDPPYIVMRYLEGGTLKEAITSRRLPFEEIAYLLRQIGPAIDYAHRQGVIHRDIKPSNIMIDGEGNAFVMDFGIARLAERRPVEGGITGSGAAVGTPDYMSPEQVMGLEEIDARADVYALAAMVFQLTTGRLPFESNSPMVTMMMHLRDAVPSAAALNPELPPGTDAVFQKAMAKDPGLRYPSIREFIIELLQILGGAIVTVPSQLQLAAQELIHQRAKIEKQTLVEPTDSEKQTTPSEQNKTVTVLYANAAEFTEIIDMAKGALSARKQVDDLWRAADHLVTKHGGQVFNRSELDFLAIWGSESAREDDPEQTIHAALAIRQLLQEMASGLVDDSEPLPIQIGIHTGLALLTRQANTGTFTASGATISLANRVGDHADGLVLITHDTFRHVQGVFDIEPDVQVRTRQGGGHSFINTYRVLAAKPRPFRLRPRGVEGMETRLIGRQFEMEQLQKAFFNAVQDSETQMVTIIGDPGLGKSRLLFEFATWAGLRPEMYFIFRSRATPAMTNSPYALWRDILSFRFEIRDSDSPRIVQQKMEKGVKNLIGADEAIAHLMGHLAGFDFTNSPYLARDPQAVAEKGRQAVIRFFRRLAHEDPVIMQLDDLHHADDSTLDLLAELVNTDAALSLLVVGTARPELYERRPSWGIGQEYHRRITLLPLDKRDSRDLVAEILQKVDFLPRHLRDLIVDQADGNPYYVEELVKMLIEDRIIQKIDPQRWTVEVSRLERLRVPPTLLGLLQARFDSLLFPEKLILQRAAVIGRVFYDSALQVLDDADDTHVSELTNILDTLVEREFIYQRETSAYSGSTEYIFVQAMLRDLILETLLSRQREAYSRAAAAWLIKQSGERVGEYGALIAGHFETAGESELAAHYLSKAGDTAVVRGALDDSLSLYERGLSLLAPEKAIEQHMALQLKVGQAWSWKGNYAKAHDYLVPALETARQVKDRLSEANALAQLGRLAGIWQGDFLNGRKYLEEALFITRELDDRPAAIFILRQLGNLAYITGSFDEARNHLEESLALAYQADDRSSIANALNSLGECARSAGNFDRAHRYYEEALAALGDNDIPSLRALIMTNQGFLHIDREDFLAALITGKATQTMVERINTQYLLSGCLQILGAAAVGLGQQEEGTDYLIRALALCHSMGNLPELLNALSEYARLLALSGDKPRAVAILGLTLSHPSLTASSRRRVEINLAHLKNELSAPEFESAIDLGNTLQVTALVEELLSQADQMELEAQTH